MIPSSQRKAIADLLRREVVPAIGCTEPMAVALCTARARELLGGLPERIEVLLSANILKNAMGVGIPGTGMIGLPIAVALGAQIGRSEYGLEVLRDVTPEAVHVRAIILRPMPCRSRSKRGSPRRSMSKCIVRRADGGPKQ